MARHSRWIEANASSQRPKRSVRITPTCSMQRPCGHRCLRFDIRPREGGRAA